MMGGSKNAPIRLLVKSFKNYVIFYLLGLTQGNSETGFFYENTQL
jgi:hypothetical protein